MDSEIFDEYAKVALDKGLIKEAQEETEKTNPRYDSLTIEDIRSLYGVEPDGEQDHIVEQAHPDSVYVSPAYDRANGLVENLLERQDLIHHIVTKPNHGKHIQERYVKAHQDLIKELTKTAFMLDRDNQEDLMKIADDCAVYLDKYAALATSTILLLGAGALGAVSLINNFGGERDRGVLLNAYSAIRKLKKVYDNVPSSMHDRITQLINDIDFVRVLNEELSSEFLSLDENAKSKAEEGKEKLKKYIKAVNILNKRINDFIPLLSGAQNRSWLEENFGDWGGMLQDVGELVLGEDVNDAITTLETLSESLNESISGMKSLYKTTILSVKKGDLESLESLLNQDVKASEDEPKDTDMELSEPSELPEQAEPKMEPNV